jgi:beta-carotene ketolase (CrtW type)
MTEKMSQYSPPRSDLKGLLIACGIFILFFLFWYHALFQIDLRKTPWFDIIGTFLILEFLYTGLFITCHDAMHGAVSYHVSSKVITSHYFSIVFLASTIK